MWLVRRRQQLTDAQRCKSGQSCARTCEQAIRALIVRRGSPGGGGYGPASARAASPGGTAGAGGAGGTAGGAASAGGTRGAAGAGGAGAASPRCYSHNRLEFA
ncbi:unnamed protein product [Closterium sp. NIES-54]